MRRDRRLSSAWPHYLKHLWFSLIETSSSHHPYKHSPWFTSTQVDILLTAITLLSASLHIVVETQLVLPRDASTSTSRPAFLFLSSTFLAAAVFSMLIICSFFRWEFVRQSRAQLYHVKQVITPIVTATKTSIQITNDQSKKQIRRYTATEVATHNTRDDAWLIINGRVYAVGKWAQEHPGGEMIIRAMAGKDATDPFLVMHPKWIVDKMLPRFEIGVLDTYQPTPLQKDFREILVRMENRGFFKTSMTYYVMKWCWQAVLLLITLAFIVYGKHIGHYIVSAIVLGVFWQQMAFLGHDYGHNSVTGSKRGDWLGSLLVTTFFGVSGQWWKGNHNLHHVITNSVDYDPDIQHLPFMAITEKIFQGVRSFYYDYHFEFDRVARFMVSYQHLLYYPLLMGIARYNLYVQSIMLVLNPRYKVYGRWGEIASLIAFWMGYCTMMSYLPTWSTIIIYNLIAHAVAGFIHVQITLSHFGMPAYWGRGYEQDHPEHFIRIQFGTTMDVDCPRALDWFHGGLQFQTVHHLYPRIPRHRLRQVRDEYILPLIAKYDITYHLYSGTEAHHKVICALRDTAMAARTFQYNPSDSKISDMLNVQG